MTSEPSDGIDAGGSSSGASLSGVDPPRSGAGRFGARPTRPGIAPPWEALWRVAVAEESMAPALFHGDWLLLDPTVRRWPRRGSVVVFREPGTALLAVKRVAGGPRDRIRIAAGMLHLGPGQAWLLGDNAVASIDSRRYGPVEVESLVARAWFRYAPAGRVGPIPRRRA